MNAAARKRDISERKEETGRSVRLWCKDQWKDFKVYRVPVRALLLNVDNRRFAAERRWAEEKLGHALDPENNPNDETSIISLLLDENCEAEGDVVKGKPS